MGRRTGLALVGVGVFLVVLGLLSRYYAYDRLAVAPGDQRTITHSRATHATIFDIASHSEVTTDLESTQNVIGDPQASKKASDKLGKPVDVWETLVYTDKPQATISSANPPLSATHDRIAFDAHTAQTINCCGKYISSSANLSTGAEVRDTTTPVHGLYFSFPFNAQRKTYLFWDGNLKRATPIRFMNTATIQGLTVYRYQQVIPPTKVQEIQAPASFFGIKKPGNVTIDEVYANIRTLWVEPVTGVIIRGQERQHVVGDYNGRQVAVLTDALIGYDKPTITDMVHTYKSKAQTLVVVRVWLPLVGVIGGVLLLLFGAFLLVREAALRRRPGATDSPTST
ncbi:MAG: DUF3068 domain-containing protein [Nocardioides sp.]